MGAVLLALVHSPLVGSSTWSECASVLSSLGRPSVAPDLASVFDEEPPWTPRLANRVVNSWGGPPRHDEVVLIVHSGAGGLVPSIHAVAASRVSGALFVDAVLPRPGQCWFDTAPLALSQRLRSLARAGVLPPWNEWFPRESIDAHLPDERLRARFLAELPRLPLAYFEEIAPEVAGWERMRCGYLQLSDAYIETAREAAARGWTSQHEPTDHLAMVTRPETIVAALDRMLEQMGFPRRS